MNLIDLNSELPKKWLNINSDTLKTNKINVDLIESLDKTNKINLSVANTINLEADNIYANGVEISTGVAGVENPMISSLDADNYDINNVNKINSKTAVLNGASGGFGDNALILKGSLFNTPLKIECSSAVLTVKDAKYINGQKSGITVSGDTISSQTDLLVRKEVVRIITMATEDHTILGSGTDYKIYTTNNGQTTSNERFRIGSDNTTYVTGNGNFSGNIESVTRTENGINGELVKIVSTNTYAGTDAGNNGSSSGNTSYGNNVLSAVVGTSNSGYGQDCLQKNTSGTYNCGYGKIALQDNLTGNFNNAFGYGTFLKNIASNNTGFGHTVGLNTTTGTNNVYIGYRNNDSGNFDDCTSIGASCQNGGNNSTTIGSGTTGTKANQCMICNNTVTEIVPMSNGVCDLGSSTNSFKNLQINSINGFTPVGGIYSATADGSLISGGTEQSLLPLSGIGTLALPSDGLKVGDTFHLVCSGLLVGDKDDVCTIKIKQNAVPFVTLSVDMEDTTGGYFEIEVDIQIRTIGVSGTIKTSLEMVYNKNILKDIRGSRVFSTATIDTTILTTLSMTAQFAGVLNSTIQTEMFYLRKQY